MPDVPELVRNKARSVGADTWLAGLPALVADLEDEWGIDVGPPFADGTEAYVAAATLADGTPAVLKLCIPRDLDAARREITVLRLAEGAGCAALLRHDLSREAMLLERLGPSMADLGLPLAERIPRLVAAAGRIWRPVPDVDLPTRPLSGLPTDEEPKRSKLGDAPMGRRSTGRRITVRRGRRTGGWWCRRGRWR